MRRKAQGLGAPGKRVRTPTRLSLEATECGAVSLAIVLEHLGSYVPLTLLRMECGVSRDGSKASNLLRAARKHGCEGRGFRKEPAQLSTMPMPVIIHWEFNHFLVLEGFGENHVYLNDPFCGPRIVTKEKFDRAFTGVVLVIEPGANFVPKGPRPPLLLTLARRLSGSWAGISYVVLAGLALAIPSMLVPAFMQVFVDDILIAGERDWLTGLFAGMALTAVLRAALTWLQRATLQKLLVKLGVGMSSTFLWHALRLPIGFFFARSAGDMANRVQLNDAVAATLSDQLARGILDLLLIAFYGLLMFFYDPALALIGVFTALGYVGLMRIGERVRRDLSRQVAHDDGKLAGVAVSGLQLIETIKSTGSESDFFAHWASYHAKLLRAQERLARSEQWLNAAVVALSQLNVVCVLGLGALRVIDGKLSVGSLVAFESLMLGFIAPLQSLTLFAGSLRLLEARVERLDDVRNNPQAQLLAGAAATSAHSRALSGQLELKGVKFGYVPFEPPLLEPLDLNLAPGQRVALVGGSGSGKSTVAKLVMGLYAPWAGEIRFDGVPRGAIARETLSAGAALVDQDISLFEGTIRENLTLWDDTVSEAEIVQAAKDACIHDDILKLPGGYDARLEEGGHNLSGGQRQRLELARALVRQPALLVLDEATSALDSETEHRIDENLRRRGCSCLIVAHRLSTVRDSDEILVLERGRVVQRGTHDRLIAEGGVYGELSRA